MRSRQYTMLVSETGMTCDLTVAKTDIRVLIDIHIRRAHYHREFLTGYLDKQRSRLR